MHDSSDSPSPDPDVAANAVTQPSSEAHILKSDALLTERGLVSEFENQGKVVDYTKIPNELELRFDGAEVLEDAVRPTTITTGDVWSKISYNSLLSDETGQLLDSSQLSLERNRAFDLLDSLTNSGAITLNHASLHVILASTYCFDQSVMKTIVQDNINPIERLEKASMIMASVVHGQPEAALPRHRRESQ